MNLIISVNQQIKCNIMGGGNSFYVLFGDIFQDEQGNYFYTEYAKENPQTIAVNNMPEECKNYVLSIIK